ncbi:MAG TPA: endonuclease VIII Nei2 [Mycolicibacterium fallax]|nr:endonuclease VIII Nei2 [Mycolicibacterium fallax]
MPEGDTVYRTAAALRTALTAQVLTRCDIRVPRFATVDLTGARVDEVFCRGKHLFIRAGRASIHSHLGMDGAWRLGPPRVPDHRIRVILATAENRATGVDLDLLEVLDRSADLAAVAQLGPDLLGPDWDPGPAVANLLAAPDRPLAAALLDQRNLAGIGNVYANELCFVTGVAPGSPVRAVPDPVRLVNRARLMLSTNLTRAIRTTTGDTRRGRELWVYGRAGRDCRRCGTPIRRSDDGPRISFWCPSCQR